MAAGMCRFCSRVDLSAWEILAQGSWELGAVFEVGGTALLPRLYLCPWGLLEPAHCFKPWVPP